MFKNFKRALANRWTLRDGRSDIHIIDIIDDNILITETHGFIHRKQVWKRVKA